MKTAARAPGESQAGDAIQRRAAVPPRGADVSAPAPDPADARTRDRVTTLLMELGPSTAVELGQRLGLTPAGIRRHLDAMIASGAISAREPRPGSAQPQRGRGRPARHYALTEAGHAAGPVAYDDLASSALVFLFEHGGEQAIEQFARQRAGELAQRVSARLDPAATAEAGEVAGALTAEGYAATVHPVANGTQLCQHHCPVQAVAARFPQLCEAETAALSQLLDTHVQRLATIAHGDGVCTTHVPRNDGPRSAAPVTEGAPDRSDALDAPRLESSNSHRKVSP